MLELKTGLSGAVREIRNPSDGRVAARVAEASPADLERAVAAARQAFDHTDWPHLDPRARARLLLRLADATEADEDELARLESINTGRRVSDTRWEVRKAAVFFRHYAGLITHPHGGVVPAPGPTLHTVVREPVGVCGLIAAWNYPLIIAATKLAPALAAGNTVLFKPAELTPLSAIRLFDLMHAAGFPPGVAHLLLGDGPTVGAPLTFHPQVDMVSFTGGTRTGQQIMAAAAAGVKKVHLELGGKSPMLVFADADLDRAAETVLGNMFCNAGQYCAAPTRLLVQAGVHDELVRRVVERVSRLHIGGGDDPAAEFGPVISAAQLARVEEYVRIGRAEGATVASGGGRPADPALQQGYFYLPTVFTGVHNGMRIAREEIFGPVLAVIPFGDEAEAVAIANDSDYGLAAGVFSGDGGRALRVARRLRAGTVWVNTWGVAPPEAPWGGYKQSGVGREHGVWGLDEYSEVKQIAVHTGDGR